MFFHDTRYEIFTTTLRGEDYLNYQAVFTEQETDYWKMGCNSDRVDPITSGKENTKLPHYIYHLYNCLMIAVVCD